MFDQIIQVRVADPLAEVKALEEERQRRLALAREKRLVERAALVARHKGETIYHYGRTVHVAVLPHPTNQGEVVEIWLGERGEYLPQPGRRVKEIKVQSVVVWVRAEKDKNPRNPLLRGETWVQVLNLVRIVPAGAKTVEPEPYWSYIPGTWEEVISAKAGEITEEIRERRQEEAAKRVEELTRLLVPPRSV